MNANRLAHTMPSSLVERVSRSLREGVERAAVAIVLLAAPATIAAQQGGIAPGAPYVAVGLFFGAIEEGARIFTPTRLLPLQHPEAGGHQFPTAQRLHGPEFPLLVWLGDQVGMRLSPTLQRYPTEPAPDWPYTAFRPPPDTSALRRARVLRRPRSEATVPGLRAVLFDGPDVVAFLVDTRGVSLAERGMERATAMGLDLSRARLLERMRAARPTAGEPGLMAVVFGP